MKVMVRVCFLLLCAGCAGFFLDRYYDLISNKCNDPPFVCVETI